VVLLNPHMEDIMTIGIGLAGRQLRERFLGSFQSCYYLQPLEKAAIFRAYPNSWQVWIEKESDYELLAETPQKPNSEDLNRILFSVAGEDPDVAQPRKKGLLASMQEFLRALSQ
jgi:hypothetical protein